jgi:hypothetical protein
MESEMQSRANDCQINDEYPSDDSDLPEVREIIRREIQKRKATKNPTKPVAQRRQPKFYHPLSIYRRYVHKRGTWYKSQPAESIKTKEMYRKAMGLPADYSVSEYEWCLKTSQMGHYCTADRSKRQWTKEEKMAFLDWSTEEDERWYVKVAKYYNPASKTGRRPCREIWAAAEKDTQEQEELYKILDIGSTKETAIIIG